MPPNVIHQALKAAIHHGSWRPTKDGWAKEPAAAGQFWLNTAPDGGEPEWGPEQSPEEFLRRLEAGDYDDEEDEHG